MKVCSACGLEKVEGEFHRTRRNKDGLQARCKWCVKEYDAGRWQRRDKTAWRQKKLEYRRKTAAWMDKLKADTPCCDCGQTFAPVAMDWDHLPGFVKVDNVSNLVRTGKRLKAEKEIQKCELVCRNCHAIRTLDRRLDN